MSYPNLHAPADNRPIVSLAELHAAAGEIAGINVAAHFARLDNDEALEPGLDRYIEGIVDAHKEFRFVTAERDTFADMLDMYREGRRERLSGTAWARGYNSVSHDFLALLENAAKEA